MPKKRRRKKSIPGTRRLRYPLLGTALLLLLLISPWLIWLAQPETPVQVLVYDKTVPSIPPRQHATLGWALHHLKFLDMDGDRHQIDLSYRGYHPREPEGQRIIPLDPIPHDTDIVYIADAYGIYKREQDIATFLADGERNLIYGGMDQSDVDALRSFLNRDVTNTVVAE